MFSKSAFLKSYETFLAIGTILFSILIFSESKLWSQVFVNGKLVECDMVLSRV